MTTCRAKTESGHTIILHGAAAVRAYVSEVETGLAEPLIAAPTPTAMSADDHQRLRDLGQCYGPCGLRA